MCTVCVGLHVSDDRDTVCQLRLLSAPHPGVDQYAIWGSVSNLQGPHLLTRSTHNPVDPRSSNSVSSDTLHFLLCLQMIGRRLTLFIATLLSGMTCVASIPIILFGQSLLLIQSLFR